MDANFRPGGVVRNADRVGGPGGRSVCRGLAEACRAPSTGMPYNIGATGAEGSGERGKVTGNRDFAFQQDLQTWLKSLLFGPFGLIFLCRNVPFRQGGQRRKRTVD